ncbi:MAG: glycosyltransferase family 4 protein [Candidatus Helarchaeota archaeon]
MGDYPVDTNIVHGGVEEVTLNLVNGLERMDDLEIHVVTCINSIERDYIKKNGRTTIHYQAGQKRFNRVTLDLFDTLRIRKKLIEINPDIVHTHDQGKYTQATFGKSYPVVITISTISREVFKMKKSLKDNLIRKNFAILLENRCLKRAKSIIAISPFVRKTFDEKTNATFYEIPNPVRNSYFSIEDREEKNRILFAGRIVPLKGIHILLKSLAIVRKSIPNIKAIIAGPILEEDYYRENIKFIRNNNLWDNVHFLGQLNQDRIVEEYTKCSIFIIPSFAESFSLVAAQAQAAGKPVIASNAGGLTDVIIDGKSGFIVDPGDYKELARKILLLLNNRKLRKKMGKRGKEIAKKRFMIDDVAHQVKNVYDLIYNHQK